MSLKITNKATAKQIATLQKLEYLGIGDHAPENLTITEASELIDELFTEQRDIDLDDGRDTWDPNWKD